MKVVDLRFTDSSAMQAAFQHTQDRSAVDSCNLEPDELRMRFAAPDQEADELAARIYLDGGLRWCSAHAIADC